MGTDGISQTLVFHSAAAASAEVYDPETGDFVVQIADSDRGAFFFDGTGPDEAWFLAGIFN